MEKLTREVAAIMKLTIMLADLIIEFNPYIPLAKTGVLVFSLPAFLVWLHLLDRLFFPA